MGDFDADQEGAAGSFLFAGISHLPASVWPSHRELFRHGHGQDRVRSQRGDGKATAQATGLIRETKTDDSGHYLMPLLPIGDYTVRVDSAALARSNRRTCACKWMSIAN